MWKQWEQGKGTVLVFRLFEVRIPHLRRIIFSDAQMPSAERRQM